MNSHFKDADLVEESSIEIPNEIVGKFIGRNGSNIKQVKQTTGCWISLASSSEDGARRKVTLVGKKSQINQAKEQIEKLNEENANSVEFLAPRSKIGLLIGKNGETIKKIKSQTGAFINIRNQCDNTSSIQISGSKRAVEEANMKVLEALNQEYTCGICMDVVSEKDGKESKYGILPSCSHCFCLECIMEWRRSSFDEKKTCPICRVEQDFIIPSNYWVENTTSKKELVLNFKNNASKKKCKNMYTFGSCWKSDKCIYSHRVQREGQHVETAKIHTDVVGCLLGKNMKSIQRQFDTQMMLMQSVDEDGNRELKVAGCPSKVKLTIMMVKMLELDFRLNQVTLSLF